MGQKGGARGVTPTCARVPWRPSQPRASPAAEGQRSDLPHPELRQPHPRARRVAPPTSPTPHPFCATCREDSKTPTPRVVPSPPPFCVPGLRAEGLAPSCQTMPPRAGPPAPSRLHQRVPLHVQGVCSMGRVLWRQRRCREGQGG